MQNNKGEKYTLGASALAPTSGLEPDPLARGAARLGWSYAEPELHWRLIGAPFTGRGLFILGGSTIVADAVPLIPLQGSLV